jgi:pantothenate kinase type III
VNAFLTHVEAQIGATPKLVVAGGAAAGVLARLDIEHVRDPLLVFRGMLVE